MYTMMKRCLPVFALVLAFTMLIGLCVNGFTVSAVENTSEESRTDSIIKELFGDGVSTEEAFDKLLAETEVMHDYENQPFYYVPNKDSYYVAFGDETAAITTRQTSTYVDKLAKELGISYKNLAKAQMNIQEVYDVITENNALVAKADLISIGFSNYGATYFMCKYMAGQTDKVTEEEWIALVGEENMPLVEDLLEQMFKKLYENNISEFGGYDLEGGLECYAYAYLSNAIHQSQVIEAIRVINPKAVILLVGSYNDLENVKLDVNGEPADLGEMMTDLVNASNLLATRNAAAYERVAYVDAPNVATTLDGNAAKYTTPSQYVFAIVGRQGLPTADGHTYIKNQIKSAMSKTCAHIWDEGVVTTNPTCTKDGVKTYVCSWCGATKTESVPAYGEHVWDEGVVTKEPTATTDGERTHTCERCGEKKTEVIEKTGEVTVLTGDVNGDGRINARDARALLRYLAGMEEMSEEGKTAADFNGDGRINARDARAILQYLAGIG